MKATLLQAPQPTFALVLLAIACGSTPPPANQPPGELLPLTTPSGTGATPPPTQPPPAASTAAPTPTASASAKTPRPAPAGTPMVVSEGEKEVTSAYSISGGIIRIRGTADLQISREALSEVYGFTFGLNTGKNMLKITPYKGQLGDVYRLFIFREDASHQPVSVTSNGPPFVIKLPLKGAKTANLVVATSENGKAKYTVFAPKTIQTADTGDTAVFELGNLPGEAILHLTSAPPTP
ncbi:MAG: hypothetical protein RMJ98_14485 [Myxococcales bacterium]|nr:hypothetical protein [Polyangiaceae bacterium]MDW8250499.1 hypothetical protein [Myxococcales bacterium]